MKFSKLWIDDIATNGAEPLYAGMALGADGSTYGALIDGPLADAELYLEEVRQAGTFDANGWLLVAANDAHLAAHWSAIADWERWEAEAGRWDTCDRPEPEPACDGDYDGYAEWRDNEQARLAAWQLAT